MLRIVHRSWRRQKGTKSFVSISLKTWNSPRLLKSESFGAVILSLTTHLILTARSTKMKENQKHVYFITRLSQCLQNHPKPWLNSDLYF
ncbi:rCG57924 [Rattus norvegicus]|uniref:RCG57924 n=1 Tax=Rattus norvegicus TaxID=10116 RepID=A6J4D0_RAT|nr:rCG57924 [Rattus norvegicus]